MLNHVVLIKFKKDVAEKAIQELEDFLEELPNKIFEIHSYEFGRDIIHSDRTHNCEFQKFYWAVLRGDFQAPGLLLQ